jgi:hypothetical protein
MHRDGLSYRLIGRSVGFSKNAVMEIMRAGCDGLMSRDYRRQISIF